MPTEPADFDPNRCSQVLRLRFRDWVWPIALLLAASIPVLASIDVRGIARPIGEFCNEYGPIMFGALLVVAGVRWCWVGRLGAPRPDRCGRCGYAMMGLDQSDPAVRCPECGADGRERTAMRPVPLARVLLDLPGVLVGLRPPCASGRGLLRGVSFMVGIVVETPKVVSHETVHRSICESLVA